MDYDRPASTTTQPTPTSNASEERAKSTQQASGAKGGRNASEEGLDASKHASKRVQSAHQGGGETTPEKGIKTIKEDLQAIVRGLEEEGIQSKWLDTLRQVAGRVSQASSTRQAPGYAVEKRLEAIEKSLAKLAADPKPIKTTWATVAANGMRIAPETQATHNSLNTKPRHTVRVSIPTAKDKSNEDILGEVKKTISAAVAVRVLHSGDVDVVVPDEAAKDRAQALPSTQEMRIHKRDYLVAVDGLPLSTGIAGGKHADNTHLASQICERSKNMAPGIQISRIEWLYPQAQVQRMRDAGKTHGTLIVGFHTEGMRRSAIQGGLVIGAQLYEVGYFDRSLQEKQCFNCQQWGHTGKVCVKQARCGRCAGNHQTSQCMETKMSCAACGKAHAAWHRRECTAYQRHHDEVTRRRLAARTHTLSIRDAPSQTTDAQGWTTVPNKRPREASPKPTIPRRVGRPTIMEVAARDPQQSRIDFAGSQASGEAFEFGTQNE